MSHCFDSIDFTDLELIVRQKVPVLTPAQSEASAAIYSLIETAKANGTTYPCMRDTVDLNANDLNTLLPDASLVQAMTA
ncbi:hypothetical protein ACFIOZ_11445 [Vreelandella sp. F11]|uniref:hypothetical protein n=1 Tax=Vreelandella sp. F11 TaxID=3394751 RepID=UPI0036DCC610